MTNEQSKIYELVLEKLLDEINVTGNIVGMSLPLGLKPKKFESEESDKELKKVKK